MIDSERGSQEHMDEPGSKVVGADFHALSQAQDPGPISGGNRPVRPSGWTPSGRHIMSRWALMNS
jgi:hypothetical protein